MSEKRRERRMKARIESDKKDYKTIIDVGSNYLIKDSKTNPDGTKFIHLEVSDSELKIGHEKDDGRFKPAFISHTGELNMASLIETESHYCFVDTNKLKKQIPQYDKATHLVGFYIFKINEIVKHHDHLEINHDF